MGPDPSPAPWPLPCPWPANPNPTLKKSTINAITLPVKTLFMIFISFLFCLYCYKRRAAGISPVNEQKVCQRK
jgi:hypothetical protein